MTGAMQIRIDTGVAAVVRYAGWLVLPVSLLLFLQWPLRDLLHAWSQQANDLAQWVFALYVAVAVTQATRARTHLAIGHHAARSWLGVLFVLPWAVFILVAGAGPVWQSAWHLEAFGETGNPGYFLVKLAAWLLALLMLLQGITDLFRREP